MQLRHIKLQLLQLLQLQLQLQANSSECSYAVMGGVTGDNVWEGNMWQGNIV